MNNFQTNNNFVENYKTDAACLVKSPRRINNENLSDLTRFPHKSLCQEKQKRPRTTVQSRFSLFLTCDILWQLRTNPFLKILSSHKKHSFWKCGKLLHVVCVGVCWRITLWNSSMNHICRFSHHFEYSVICNRSDKHKKRCNQGASNSTYNIC